MFLFIILEKNSKNFTGMFLSVQNVIPMVISYENLSQLYNSSCSPEANKSKTTCRIWANFYIKISITIISTSLITNSKLKNLFFALL